MSKVCGEHPWCDLGDQISGSLDLPALSWGSQKTIGKVRPMTIGKYSEAAQMQDQLKILTMANTVPEL